LAAFIVTLHVPVPVQAPLHPMNVQPALGVAASVTSVPLGYVAEHVAPQLITGDPGDVLTTVPCPFFITVSVKDEGGGPLRLNVAVTDLAASIVTVQLPAPAQAPLQPVKVESALGAAVSVTMVPLE